MGDAMRQNTRFTGTRSGKHEQRSFRTEHRFFLGTVQAIEIEGHTSSLLTTASEPDASDREKVRTMRKDVF